MLPGQDATENEFGYPFNGYEALPDCSDLANQTAIAFEEHGTVPMSLEELRGCLFYEQRRNRHCGSEASKKDLNYYHAIIAAMREILEDQTACNK